MRTENEILKDFETLGYKIVEQNELSIIFDNHTTIEDTHGFIRNYYEELERISIYKPVKSYKKDYNARVNGKLENSNQTWFSMQEHKLLNELFQVWGWV